MSLIDDVRQAFKDLKAPNGHLTKCDLIEYLVKLRMKRTGKFPVWQTRAAYSSLLTKLWWSKKTEFIFFGDGYYMACLLKERPNKEPTK